MVGCCRDQMSTSKGGTWPVGGTGRRSTPGNPSLEDGGEAHQVSWRATERGPYESAASWSRRSVSESDVANWEVGTQAPSTTSTFGPEHSTWPSQAPSAGHEIENDRPAAMFTAMELESTNKGGSKRSRELASGILLLLLAYAVLCRFVSELERVRATGLVTSHTRQTPRVLRRVPGTI